MTNPIVSISIDTEEDNWGSYSWSGATVRNIQELPRLQEVFDKHGAKPSYLVNHAPLVDAAAVTVLGGLASRDDVEIGGHCHPWNTPPRTPGGEENSMMFGFSEDVNQAKLAAVRARMRQELDVTPITFRAGRWGFGPTVARALATTGFKIDCSVSPFIDWSDLGGPDYSDAPSTPYRFEPESPFTPHPSGSMVQLPTTIGFLRGDHADRARLRRRIEKSSLARLKVIGLLDRMGLLARRWLSPETTSGDDMVRLADAWIASVDPPFVQLTFHSCTLLPGATPFVRDVNDQSRFLAWIDQLLSYLADRGAVFATLREAAGLTTDATLE